MMNPEPKIPPRVKHTFRTPTMSSSSASGTSRLEHNPPTNNKNKSSLPSSQKDVKVTSTGRKKGPNWSPEETATLLHALIEEKANYHGVFEDAEYTDQAKQDGWMRVYDKVNAISRSGRSLESCQRKVTHYVSEMRLKYYRIKNDLSQSGREGVDPSSLMKPHEKLALEYGGIYRKMGKTAEKMPPQKYSDWVKHKKLKDWSVPTMTSTVNRQEYKDILRNEDVCEDRNVQCYEYDDGGEGEQHTTESSQSEQSKDSQSYSDPADTNFNDVDMDECQELGWKLPKGNMEIPSSADSGDSCLESRSHENIMPAANKTLEAVKKVGKIKRIKHEGYRSNVASPTGIERAAALLRITKERSYKKRTVSRKGKSKRAFKSKNRNVGQKHYPTNAEGRPTTPIPPCCSCSSVFTELVTRLVGVQEKLTQSDEEKTETLKQVSHAITVLCSFVIRAKPPSQSQSQVDRVPPATPPEQSRRVVPLASAHGAMTSSSPSKGQVLQANGSEKTPPPLNLAVNKRQNVHNNEDDDNIGREVETDMEQVVNSPLRPEFRKKRGRSKVVPAADRKMRRK